MDVYDYSTSTLSSSSISAGRDALAAACLNSNAYFAGGVKCVPCLSADPLRRVSAAGTPVNVVDIVNTTALVATATLAVARSNLGGGAAGTLVLFAGGKSYVQPTCGMNVPLTV